MSPSTSNVFGRMTIIRRVGQRHCECQCECGATKTVGYYDVLSGKTKSCGCLKREVTTARNKATATRGGITHSPVGASWSDMMTRCYNPNCKDYHNYGKRGIVACEFIRASPLNILLLIGDRPHDYTLDRINVNGGYTCGKCAECVSRGHTLNLRWATRAEQTRNQRRNHLVTIGDEVLCVMDWSKRAGLKSESAFRLRLKRGWEGRELLLPPGTRLKAMGGVA